MNRRQASDIVFAHFSGVPTPVMLVNCDGLEGVLHDVFVTWPFQLSSVVVPATARMISIERRDDGYHVSSPWMAESVRQFEHPVDVACWLVVELSWAFLDANPAILCLHCAAVEISGRLVVLPNRYRAGKSVLSACLAARGQRVFGDDILPVEVGGDGRILGVSTGVAPRLRLPLPDDLGAGDPGFLADRAGRASDRYVYLDLGTSELARRGEVSPIGSIVLLERAHDAGTRLEAVSKADVLQAAIWQNFSRQLPPASILNLMRCLVEGTEHHRLHYSNASEAADCLLSAFADWRLPVATARTGENVGLPAMPRPQGAALDQDPVIGRMPGVFECEADGESFLASPAGASIFRLNLLASAIWRLLETPMRPSEIVDIVHSAFPDEDGDMVRRDVMNLIQSLYRESFVEVADQLSV